MVCLRELPYPTLSADRIYSKLCGKIHITGTTITTDTIARKAGTNALSFYTWTSFLVQPLRDLSGLRRLGFAERDLSTHESLSDPDLCATFLDCARRLSFARRWSPSTHESGFDPDLCANFAGCGPDCGEFRFGRLWG
jgi:hypothetical protein